VNSVIALAVLIRPILPVSSVNQRFPSEPTAIPRGKLPGLGRSNSVSAPHGVTRPIRLPCCSVNQTPPSGPAMISTGPLFPRRIAISAGAGAEVRAAAVPSEPAVNAARRRIMVGIVKERKEEAGSAGGVTLPTESVDSQKPPRRTAHDAQPPPPHRL